MTELNDIYRMLDSRSEQEEQLYGIALAQKIEDLSVLILPFANGESKGLWENCAKALCALSDERLEKYLPAIFEWLQDLTWPGSLIILERLKNFSGQKMKTPFIERFSYVSSLKSEEGLIWMDYLSELLDNEELRALLPKFVLDKLYLHYKNWGFWDSDPSNC